jgi:hypothetical protein
MKELFRAFILLIGLLVSSVANAQSYFLGGLFLEPTVEKNDLLFEPLTSLEELSAVLDSYTVRFSDVQYSHIQINTHTSSTTDDRPILKLDYSLGSKNLTAYSYQIQKKANDSIAFLVIPGTGTNQSSAIFHADLENYHGDIVNTLKTYGDVQVLLKKNEDGIALHDGYGKLTKQALISSLISRGGSYGALYLADGMALLKYLNALYSKVFVIGLSQGGEAAFILSLLSNPYGCITSSGYSVFWNDVYPSDLDGLLMFERNALLNIESIKATINRQSTKYLLTYGTQDYTTYTMVEEALSNTTCSVLADLPNVRCSMGDHGHIFPKDRIVKFIMEGIPPKPVIVSESDTIFSVQGSSVTLTANDPLSDYFTWYKNGELLEVEPNSDSIEINSDGSIYVVGSNAYGAVQSQPVVTVFYPDVTFAADSVEHVSSGKTLTLTAKYFPGNKYQWFNENSLVSSENTVNINETGIYHVDITTAQGVSARSRAVTVIFHEKISVNEDDKGRTLIEVFLDDEFSGPANLTIFDGNGRKIQESHFEIQNRKYFENFDLSFFESGMYIVNLRGRNFFAQKKFVKTN